MNSWNYSSIEVSTLVEVKRTSNVLLTPLNVLMTTIKLQLKGQEKCMKQLIEKIAQTQLRWFWIFFWLIENKVICCKKCSVTLFLTQGIVDSLMITNHRLPFGGSIERQLKINISSKQDNVVILDFTLYLNYYLLWY